MIQTHLEANILKGIRSKMLDQHFAKFALESIYNWSADGGVKGKKIQVEGITTDDLISLLTDEDN